MRKPRRSEDYKEFSIVKRFSESERRFYSTGGSDLALIFPSSYEVAISSLSFSLVKDIFDENGISTERFFYHEQFKKFYSLESLRPLDEFKIWAFSYHFELDLLNIFQILKRKGVPILKDERNQNHPTIIIGGAVTYFNPEFLTEIADLVYRGDLEEYAREFSEFLRGDTSIDIPSICRKGKSGCKTAKFKDINKRPPVGKVISPYGEFKNRLLIEIGRGCIRRCAFCMIGHLQKPARFLKVETVKKILEEIPIDVPLGIISATITDYPWIDNLIGLLEGRKVSFSSMRMDGVSEKFLRFLKSSGQKTITFAPEGGTQKIRDILMKDISEGDIENAVDLSIKAGFESMKFYFIYGLEEETEEDLKGIVRLCKNAQNKGIKIKASLNPLIPKPGTPFEKRKMQDVKILKEKEKFLKRLFKENSIKADFESIRESVMQYKIAHMKNSMLKDLVETFEKHGRAGFFKFLLTL